MHTHGLLRVGNAVGASALIALAVQDKHAYPAIVAAVLLLIIGIDLFVAARKRVQAKHKYRASLTAEDIKIADAISHRLILAVRWHATDKRMSVWKSARLHARKMFVDDLPLDERPGRVERWWGTFMLWVGACVVDDKEAR